MRCRASSARGTRGRPARSPTRSRTGPAHRPEDEAASAVGARTSTCAPTPPPRGSRKLAPVFRKGGVVTAGNASGIADGAAALVVADAAFARERGLKPLGRLVAYAVAGVDRPSSWASARHRRPAPHSRAPGSRSAQMDLVEVNEAFAPQYLAGGDGTGPRPGAHQRGRRRHRDRAIRSGPAARASRRTCCTRSAAAAAATRSAVPVSVAGRASPSSWKGSAEWSDTMELLLPALLRRRRLLVREPQGAAPVRARRVVLPGQVLGHQGPGPHLRAARLRDDEAGVAPHGGDWTSRRRTSSPATTCR